MAAGDTEVLVVGPSRTPVESRCCASGPRCGARPTSATSPSSTSCPGAGAAAWAGLLLRACVDRAVARRCDFIDLATSEDDVAARHLYESEGFRRTEGEGGPLAFHYEQEL